MKKCKCKDDCCTCGLTRAKIEESNQPPLKMNDKPYKIEAPYQDDRERLILALVNSGYIVWVEEHDATGTLGSGHTVFYTIK